MRDDERSIPLPPSLTELAQFPRSVLSGRPDTELFRVHRRDREVEYYSALSIGRFDPPPGVTTFGTCYLSTSPYGAFAEVFGQASTISRTDIDDRAMTVVHVAIETELADFTAPTVLGLYGLTGTASAGGRRDTYKRCQLWAAALFEAGFGGIRYRARHDPSLTSTSIALFGAPGAESKSLVSLGEVDLAAASDDFADYFGLRIMPTAPLP